MKKIILCLGLTLVLGYAVPAAALTSALNFAVGHAHEDTVTFDLFLRQDYGAWWTGESFELRPFTTIGVSAWVEESRSQNAWLALASFGLQMSWLGDSFRPYVSVNVGPSLNTETKFADRDLGGHFLFNTRAMLGFNFGQNYRHNLGFHVTHYSNAHLYDENDGFNTLGLYYGFTFW